MVRDTLYREICERLEGIIPFDVIEEPRTARGYHSASILRVSVAEKAVVRVIGKPNTRNVRGHGEEWFRVLFYRSGRCPYNESVCIKIPGRISIQEQLAH